MTGKRISGLQGDWELLTVTRLVSAGPPARPASAGRGQAGTHSSSLTLPHLPPGRAAETMPATFLSLAVDVLSSHRRKPGGFVLGKTRAGTGPPGWKEEIRVSGQQAGPRDKRAAGVGGCKC